jgi:uncharacterized integral membrane protein
MKIVRSVVGAVIAVVVIVFILQNGQALVERVDFRLDLALVDLSPGQVPLYSILITLFFAGVLISAMVAWIHHFRLRRKFKKVIRELEEKERELDSLRNLPVLERSPQSESPPSS